MTRRKTSSLARTLWYLSYRKYRMARVELAKANLDLRFNGRSFLMMDSSGTIRHIPISEFYS